MSALTAIQHHLSVCWWCHGVLVVLFAALCTQRIRLYIPGMFIMTNDGASFVTSVRGIIQGFLRSGLSYRFGVIGGA